MPRRHFPRKTAYIVYHNGKAVAAGTQAFCWQWIKNEGYKYVAQLVDAGYLILPAEPTLKRRD
jgi:hypothetical protein